MAILQCQKLLNKTQLAQLSFPFQNSAKTNQFREEDFLNLVENYAAVNFFKKFFSQNNEIPSLILKGERFCGKTHLLHIFAQKSGAEFLDKEKISDVNFSSFFTEKSFYILEDINEIKDEELLLCLINSAAESGAFLVLSANSSLNIKLKDLTSRLKNIFVAEIKNPGYESVKLLLTHSFSRRQVKLSQVVINYLSDNIERSYEAIFAVVKLVELQVQENGKNVTLGEVKKLLNRH